MNNAAQLWFRNIYHNLIVRVFKFGERLQKLFSNQQEQVTRLLTYQDDLNLGNL